MFRLARASLMLTAWLWLAASVASGQGLPGVGAQAPTTADERAVTPAGDPAAPTVGARELIITGVALTPDGVPAAGAVVVSELGAETATGADGRFRLVVPADGAGTLESAGVGVSVIATQQGVTYIGEGRATPAPGGAFDAGAITLAISDCEPGWAERFGFLNIFNIGSADLDIRAMTVFDDGSGPAVYAGGFFTTIAGVSANGIAKWDGSSWSPLGSGVSGDSSPSVFALTVFDDGSGPALYVGGQFLTAGGVSARSIAKWNGSSWSPLGSEVSGGVFALTVFDDGSGPALYAGGFFATAGGVTTNHIARWDGASWSHVGHGMSGRVSALTVFDDGSRAGPVLYAGGDFMRAGGITVNNLAKWDGASWSSAGSGTSGTVRALTVFDDGSGLALHVGGNFSTAGGVTVNRIAKWDGQAWSPLGGGIAGILVSEVNALTSFDAGLGPVLIAGGNFTTAGGRPAQKLALWDGSEWMPSPRPAGPDAPVRALEVFDDGGGPALYAAGRFTTAGGAPASAIARWDGDSWSAVPGAPIEIFTLKVFDDGTGPALYAAGQFTNAGGVAVNNIAKWYGQAWAPLGSGLANLFGTGARVLALEVFDDGGGPALYAGGLFSFAGGAPALSIAKWDGQSWSPVGDGVTGTIESLAVYDDGGGAALYAGGSMSGAGAAPVNNIAKWNGSEWSPVGVGVNARVSVMKAFDDGDGAKLFVVGGFTVAGDIEASRIARWDGGAWTPAGEGISGVLLTFPLSLNAMVVFEDQGVPALIVGGSFGSAGGVSTNNHGVWRACPVATPPCPGDINGDGDVNGVDLLMVLNSFGDCPPAAACPADLNADGAVNGADLLILLKDFGVCP